MRMTRRQALGVAGLMIAATGRAADGEAIMLVEDAKLGDCFRYEIALSVGGKMKVDRGGKVESLPLNARARHSFAERIEALADGGAGKVVRVYTEAQSESAVAIDRTKRDLPANRRTIIAQRTADGTLHYSPGGPLTRDELDLVAEHFDTLGLLGLLPKTAVRPGDTWPVPNDAAQSACLFEGIVKNELAGKFLETKDGVAHFEIAGKAEGIEHGANVRVSVLARGTFSLAAKRFTGIRWEQTDDRDQGPVNPAVEAKAEIVLTRTLLAEPPKELAAVKLPAEERIPDALTQLHYADGGGKFSLVYPRDWHTVVANATHLVLRLVVKGEFLCQATISEWKKGAAADFQAAAQAFRDATARQPGWVPDKALEEGLVPGDANRKIYRLSAGGKQDGTPIVQSFHLVYGPAGATLAATTMAKPETVAKLGTRDLQLVNALEFGAKK